MLSASNVFFSYSVSINYIKAAVYHLCDLIRGMNNNKVHQSVVRVYGIIRDGTLKLREHPAYLVNFIMRFADGDASVAF